MDLIREIERSKEEEDFPTRRGDGANCNWCDFKELCPEWSHLHETEQLTQSEFLSEDGVELVDDLAEVERGLRSLEEERSDLKEEKKELEKAILKYARKNGLKTVFGTEKKASIDRNEELIFPRSDDSQREDLEALIKDAGRWDEVSYLDIRSLARKFKNREWSEELLDRLEDFKRLEESEDVELEDLEG